MGDDLSRQATLTLDDLTACLEIAPIGMFLADGRGSCTFVNQEWSRLTGRTRQEGLGYGWLEAIHPEDRIRLASDWQLAVAEGRDFQTEYRYQRPDGSEIWVSTRARARRDDAGNPGAYVGTVVDVSETHRAEDKASRQQAFARALFQHSPVGIHIFSPTGTSLAMNETQRQNLGVPSTDYGVGEYNLLEDASAIASPLIDAFHRARNGEVVDLPAYEVDTTAAAERWDVHSGVRVVEQTLFPLPGRDGMPGNVVLYSRDVTRDVTAEREVQQRLQESERRFQVLFDQAYDGIGIRDGDGRLIAVNDAFRELFGLAADAPTEEISLGELFADVADRDAIVEDLAREGRSSRSYRIRRADGTLRDVHTSFVTLPGGEGKGFIGLARDITARAEAERQLRLSEANFRAALDGAAEAVVVFDEDADGEYIVSYCNARVGEMFGLPADSIVGQGFGIFMTRKEAAGGLVSHVLSDGTTQLELVRNFGKGPRTYSIRLTPTECPGTGGRRLIGTARDVTESRAAAAQANELRRLQSLTHMAGGVAHDFNNALQAIIAGVDLAVMMSEDSWEGREVLADARTAAKAASSIARNMLNFSGSVRLADSELSLSDLVGEVVQARAAANRSVAIDVEASPGDVIVRGDRNHLTDAIGHLLMNAVESVEVRGGGHVWVRSGEVVASRDLLTSGFMTQDIEPGCYAFIEIADTGEGMSEDIRRRIFDPFFTTRFVGRGMGLPAALGVVRAHHGTIIVDSEPGRGSTFRILLPMNEAEVERAAA